MFNPKRRCERWTKDEFKYLTKNYKNMKNKEIAKKLKRTPNSINQKRYLLKLINSNKWNKNNIIKELNQIYLKLKHSPSAGEVNQTLYQACLRYFGSFNKAKISAGLDIRKHKNEVYNNKLTNELAYILGVVSGDGYINLRKNKGRSSGTIGLKVKDIDFALEFQKILNIWSGHEIKFYKKEEDFYHVNLYSISATEIIKNFKLEKILSAPKIIQYQFLRGMFDSEGCIVGLNLNKRKYAARWIQLSNNNKNLINMISKILNYMNMKHSIRSGIHSGFGSKKVQYNIFIYGVDNLIAFDQNIGFSISRKQEKLIKVINSYEKFKVINYER